MTNKYPIGAVVKLTGLTSHNIRVWEKRHQAVVANRLPSGRRYYTQAQVDRLLLLKNCIALGVPIGKLAHLNDDQLREIAKQATPDKNKSLEPLNNPTLGIFGQASLASQTQNIPGLKLIFHEQSIDFSTVHLHQQALTQKPNFLILEVPSLVTSNVLSITELIKRSTPALVIIIYRFGNKKSLNGFKKSRCTINESAYR